MSTPAGSGIAARMGIEAGFLVLQRGFTDGCDQQISDEISKVSGNALVKHAGPQRALQAHQRIGATRQSRPGWNRPAGRGGGLGLSSADQRSRPYLSV